MERSRRRPRPLAQATTPDRAARGLMSESDRAHALQGTRAGFVSRVVAATIDVLIVFALLFAGQVMVAAGRYVFGEEAFELPTRGATWRSTLFLVLLVMVLEIEGG